MANHYVRWIHHNGKKGAKAFPSSVGRAKVEAFRKKQGRDSTIAEAWIEWATLPDIAKFTPPWRR